MRKRIIPRTQPKKKEERCRKRTGESRRDNKKKNAPQIMESDEGIVKICFGWIFGKEPKNDKAK